MAVPSANILTSLLTSFEGTFFSGFSHTMGWANGLLATLAILEIVTAAIWWSLTDDNAIIQFLRKVMLIGLFIFFVEAYPFLINIVVNGFVKTGLDAVTGGISMATFTNPSSIVSTAITVTEPIFTGLSVFHVPTGIIEGITGLLILACFFFLAIQIFITYLEFTIVSALVVILIPFGVLRHTAFLAEKAFGAIISFGVKLMVLAFITSAAIPVIASWTLPASPSLEQCFFVLVGALALAMLAWQAPGVAAGLLAGGPSLTAGAGVGAAIGAGAGAMLAATGTAGAVGAMVSATKAGAGALAQGAGSAATAARLGSATGTSTAGRIGGAVGGMAKAAARAPLQAAGSSLKQSYQAGGVKAFRATGGTPSAGMTAAAGGSGGTGGGASGRGPGWAQRMHSTMAMAGAAAPPVSHPQGGMSAPLNKES